MLTKITQRLRSKTYLTALTLAAITAIDAQSAFLTGSLPAEYRPWCLLAWPVAMLTLREVTTSALSDK